MESAPLGKALIAIGVLLVLAGGWIWMGPALPLGRLPGDFHWKIGAADVYLPLTTCLLVSGVLSLVLMLLRK